MSTFGFTCGGRVVCEATIHTIRPLALQVALSESTRDRTCTGSGRECGSDGACRACRGTSVSSMPSSLSDQSPRCNTRNADPEASRASRATACRRCAPAASGCAEIFEEKSAGNAALACGLLEPDANRVVGMPPRGVSAAFCATGACVCGRSTCGGEASVDGIAGR